MGPRQTWWRRACLAQGGHTNSTGALCGAGEAAGNQEVSSPIGYKRFLPPEGGLAWLQNLGHWGALRQGSATPLHPSPEYTANPHHTAC